MLDIEVAKKLAEYNAWADIVLFEAIRQLPEGAVYREGNALFKSMLGTLNHNYQVDLIWQAHLSGAQHGFSSRRDVLHSNFESLVEAQIKSNSWYMDWSKHQSAESLSESCQFKFTSGQLVKMQKGFIFLHVINHKTYHRGWVSQMFFDFGSKPPETDISVYMTIGN
jgi:uncharacterized damage-inducible protein DinB